MSDVEMTIDEPLSPDLFSDAMEEVLDTPNVNSTASSMSIGPNEPEPSVPEWKCMSLEEINKGLGVYDFQEHPPIVASSCHTVLFMLPLPTNGPLKPYPTHQIDKWSQDYVRMPYSAHSLYPIKQEGKKNSYRNRWEVIQEALLRNIITSQQLESAILSYNDYTQRWNFAALHHFFSEVMEVEETNLFFETLLPKLVQLALQLPVLLTGAVPLLKRHTNGSISLSQLQVASLLANAFFCTFPRRNSRQLEYVLFPDINFNRLFAAFTKKRRGRSESVIEKIKCILHYFRRVTSKAPEGVITIERRYIPPENCPKWDALRQKLPPLHITSKGTIENEGAGMLQMDFANRYIGGGVLGFGCVQEEIRFVICPELLVTMLVTEELDKTEALIVSGVERYSKYEGYGNTFKWTGNFIDDTPRDSSGRRMTSIVAIDALFFKQPQLQFKTDNIIRELNKAYVGFARPNAQTNLPAIATGNWGCGVYRGNPKLKVLIQLMAAGISSRSVVYFTFGNTELRDDVATMYTHLVQHDIDIGRLYSILLEYQREPASSDFYCFLYNRSRIKSLSNHFPAKSQSPLASLRKKNEIATPNKNVDNKRYHCSKDKKKETKEEQIINWLESCDDDNSSDNATLNTGNLCDDKITIPNKGTNDRKTAQYSDIENNHFINTYIVEEENKTSKLTDKSDNNVNLLTLEDSTAPSTTPDQDVPKKMRSELLESTVSNDSKSVKKHSLELCKQNSLSKKSGQKKISDFFQRIS
ncbi:poly(ADP-ribose) glycohydrolase-like [Pseudomyrmex gracilis]|uniref:poly(ADP-ribose) glycohydrolase-like n=1 Tax=Pseudomyrmex gracilis TaxID=219809 RepID=UPI000995AD5D|nr:poly(ADP-ribose) glycohydrolase-like [Pseudomyrmex gracilis]